MCIFDLFLPLSTSVKIKMVLSCVTIVTGTVVIRPYNVLQSADIQKKNMFDVN